MRLAFLLAGPACVAFALGVGCGGRTEGFVDDSLDASPDDSSFDDAIGDSTPIDARADSIGVDVRDGTVDVIRIDSGTIDSSPDAIGIDIVPIDVIGFDSGPDVIDIDTAPDVIDFDTTPDVIDIDTTPDVIGIDTLPDVIGFDTGTDGGPVDGGILCGPTRCDPATQDCCAMFGGALSCVTKGTCGGIPITCSSAASCPTGDVCCLELPGPGGTATATCVPLVCPGIQLCATSAECTPPQRCRRFFGGYRSCR